MQVKKKSQLQEKSVAKELHAKTVIASGALWGSKGDVRHDEFLVECKTTEKNHYSLTMKIWDKIRSEAIRDGFRTPLMCIDILDGKQRFAVFEKKDFKHYKTYHDIDTGDTCWSDKKSICVNHPEEVIMVRYSNPHTGKNPVFVVTPWEDFLYMLKEGVSDA